MIDCEWGSCRRRLDVSGYKELEGCYDYESPDSPYKPIAKKLREEFKKEVMEKCPDFQRLKKRREPAWDGDTDPKTMFMPTVLYRFLSGKKELVAFCPYANQDLLDE